MRPTIASASAARASSLEARPTFDTYSHRHDWVIALVEQMLDLHKKRAAASIAAERTLYQRQIEATDQQIDALVCELYGLTEEEIAIVEGVTGR